MLQELRDIRISHSSDKDYIFSKGVLFSSQGTSHNQHTLNGSHAEIIVILLTQLLGTQLI